MEKEKLLEVSRTLRSTQPAHYLFLVESVSVLLNTSIEKYESGEFEAGGYKWRLCLYPNGNKKSGGEGHISLYLEISDTTNLPLGWEVIVNFKLFIFNHIEEKYLTVQDGDGKVRHFNVMKTRCGFAQFLSLDVLEDPCMGYVMDDSCIFGAEVFVIKYNGKGECLSMIKDPVDGTFTWVIENFSTQKEAVIYSEIFTVKEYEWKLSLYQEGNGEANSKSLSLFLELANHERHHPIKFYAEFELLMKNQCGGRHVKSNAKVWFCDSSKCWGFPLSDLNHNKMNGYILNDTLIVEAKITLMTHSKNI